ncbi:hypothetical protein [Demequina sp.]|uniref:hypothetical protein n=1 Tax=Demequina sp. TaxID=2050685 RepID=UPI003A8739E5
MDFIPRPYRHVAATVALTCFSIGLFSAHGSHLIDRHHAVEDAREAAAALEDTQTRLDVSISKAEQVVNSAKGLEDESDLAAAADALKASIVDAAAAAEEANDAATSVEIVTEGVTATSADQYVDETAQAAQEIEIEADITTDDLADAQAAVTDLAAVLDGEVDDPDVARAATEQLESAKQAIDQVTADVETEAQSLHAATQEVQLAKDLATLDTSVQSALATTVSSTELISAVGRRVVTSSTVTAALGADSALRAAATRAQEVDRSNADEVSTALADLESATTGLAATMEQLQVSHEAWVEDVNAERQAANDTLMAAYQEKVEAARAEWKAANKKAVGNNQGGWTGKPTGVAGSNGRVAASSLCTLDFDTSHQLQCAAAEALEAADAAYYSATGRHISITDSYRSYASQVATKANKPSTAAVPGTSNHGWGMAVDLDYASATWLAKNGAAYGWVHPTWARAGGSRPEWWHLEYVATSVGGFEAPAKPDLEELAVSAFAR